MAILQVRDLQIFYRTRRGEARAVDGVSFDLEEGDYLGLVGESGCGKSTIAKAILQILPTNGRIAGGRIVFRGRDLVSMTRAELRRILWKDISLIPQSAMHSFDPVYRIGDQIVEAIRTHEPQVGKADARERAKALFHMVGLDEARLDDYAHQFSGGMRQRGMIAMAMALTPTLVVADEPTTALDVIVQDQIMSRIREIHRQMKNAMILITHDIAVVSESCNKIAVMYAGRVMEIGGPGVFTEPCHPYTIGLINAYPRFHDPDSELISIRGAPPDLVDPPKGCRFHHRCPFATEKCVAQEPALLPTPHGGTAACHYVDQAARFREAGRESATWTQRPQAAAPA
jgi:peptide/nickel transport system ATP-binding protein